MCESAFRRKPVTKWSHFLLYLLTSSCSLLSLYISQANWDKLSHDCNTQCISVNFWRSQPFFDRCPTTTRWLLFKVHETRRAKPLKTYVPNWSKTERPRREKSPSRHQFLYLLHFNIPTLFSDKALKKWNGIKCQWRLHAKGLACLG